MQVTPLKHESLGNTAYLVDLGDGTAAMVDAGRSIGVYLAVARERELDIRAVIEIVAPKEPD